MLATECEPGDMVFASSAIWLRRRWLRVMVLPPYCWSAVMVPASNPDLHPLIRKLESIAPVSDDERRGIAALPIVVRDLKADADNCPGPGPPVAVLRDPRRVRLPLQAPSWRQTADHVLLHPRRHPRPAESALGGHGSQPGDSRYQQGGVHPA